MAEVDVFPTQPAFPRATSLFQPERLTPALLDSASYSPFPLISGARRDPFGLDAFLLHPEDQLWSYLAPQPQAEEAQEDKSRGRPSVLQKRASAMALRKTSPLSQQSVVSSETLTPPSLSRRRSKSFDSASSHSTTTTATSDTPQKPGTVGRKGLRGFWGRRKSISSLSPDVPPLSSVTSTPSGSNVDLSLHADTSATSSEGPQTPKDSPPLGSAVTPDSDGRPTEKKKGLRSLFSRKGSNLALAAAALEAVSNDKVSEPVVAEGPVSRINPTAEQRATAFVGDQVRRSTYRKLAQLRRPSPHPLASHLRRQYSHLPHEVIASLEVGQAVYPKSVNWYQTDNGLAPAQGGLWTTLAVKIVLDKLDDGHMPIGTMTKRLVPAPMERKSKSMEDFINRLPFEERHHVYFPGAWSLVSMARPGFGVWDLDFSPYILAMAEVGKEEMRSYWPTLPRPSFGAVEDAYEGQGQESASVSVIEDVVTPALVPANVGTQVVESPIDTNTEPTPSPSSSLIPLALDEKSTDGSEEDTKADMLATPPVEATAPIPEIKIDFEGAGLDDALGSSFRRSRSTHWANESESEEDDEDHVPLAKSRIVKRASIPVLSEAKQPRQQPATMANVDQMEKQRLRAMDEVVRARERRHALSTGEVDRRAEGELRRTEEAKRRSVNPVPAAGKRMVSSSSSSSMQIQLRPQSTGGTEVANQRHSSYMDEARRRTKSGPGIAGTSRSPKLGDTKRYHSFYEIQSHASGSGSGSGSGAVESAPRPVRGGSFPTPRQADVSQSGPSSMASAASFHSPVMPVPVGLPGMPHGMGAMGGMGTMGMGMPMYGMPSGHGQVYYPQPQGMPGMGMGMTMGMPPMGMVGVGMQGMQGMQGMPMYSPSQQSVYRLPSPHTAAGRLPQSGSRSSLVVPHAKSSGAKGMQGDKRNSSFTSLSDVRRQSRRVA